MAHEVENMFYVRQKPWHGLGIQLQKAPDVREAIVAAGLDWQVEKRAIQYNDWSEKNFLDTEDHYAIVRSDNNECLGIASKQWAPLQNVDAFNFFNPFIEKGFATLETAGSLKKGKRVWVLAKIKNQIADVVKGDSIEAYLLISVGHDGKTGVNVQFTPIRVVCWNTLSRAENARSNAWHRITMKHSKNIKDSLDVVQNAIDLTNKTFNLTMESYRYLAKRQIKNLDQYIVDVLKPNESISFSELKDDEKEKALPKSHSKIIRLFENGAGQDIPEVRGTFWAAYNAITEWVDFDRGASRENRLHSAWFDQGRVIKERALKEAIKLAA